MRLSAATGDLGRGLADTKASLATLSKTRKMGDWFIGRAARAVLGERLAEERMTAALTHEHVRIATTTHEAPDLGSGTPSPNRRTFVGATVAAAVAAAAAGLDARVAHAKDSKNADLNAQLPAGFVPLTIPGRVVRVTKPGCLEPNGLYPKAADAKEMLRRALEELTGKADVAEAIKLFISPQDKVCVKPNGIALQNMSTNKELILPLLEALIAAGVAASNITVLEQYQGYMNGTRVNAKNVPAGVNLAIHANNDATMDWRMVPGTNTRTKFARVLLESTALIDMALVKDHAICGYTGALKNLTHGCTVNPQDFHVHHASPQIGILSAQDAFRSRLRLCISDGFKLMAHGGPLYKQPQYVVAHESVYASTDPVALDVIGWQAVEKARSQFGLKSLTDEGRAPAYLQVAADMGVGTADTAKISLREVTI
jgi:uncharacterized protein (DUF362 family)